MARKTLILAVAASAALAAANVSARWTGDAVAQAPATHSGPGSHSGHAAQAKGDTSPSSKAFADANAKMHKDMDIVFSGDVDVDFIKGMIPHHAGAVDMAKIVMKYGKDPDIKKLAEEIVKAQESEIVFMRAWLQKMGK